MSSLGAPKRRVDDVVLACAVVGVLLAPLPLPAQAVAALTFVAMMRRPQPAVLAGVLVVPMSAGKLTTLGLLILIIVGSAVVAWAGREARRPSRMVWVLLALGVWITVSFGALERDVAFNAPTVTDLAQPLAGITVAIVAACFPPTLRDAARISIIAVLVVGITALISPVDIYGTVEILGLNPNYVAALVTLLMAGCLIRASRWELLATCAVWPIGLLALVKTESRAGLLALAVVVAARILLSEKGRTFDLWRVVSAVIVAGALTIFVPQVFGLVQRSYFGSRDFSGIVSDNVQREVAAGASIEVAMQNPILGVGYANFAAVAAGLPGLHQYVNTHDEYTRLASELGIGGLLMFLLPVVRALARMRGTLGATLLPALLCFLASIAFGNELESIVTSYLFWMILGVALAGANTQRKRSIAKRRLTLASSIS
jgi:hypothetical protein